MLELAEHSNRVTGKPAGTIFKPLPKDDPTRRRPNIERAQSHLGWSPEVAFADGIEETIRWFETIESE